MSVLLLGVLPLGGLLLDGLLRLLLLRGLLGFLLLCSAIGAEFCSFRDFFAAVVTIHPYSIPLSFGGFPADFWNHYGKIISPFNAIVHCLFGDFSIADSFNLWSRGVRQF